MIPMANQTNQTNKRDQEGNRGGNASRGGSGVRQDPYGKKPSLPTGESGGHEEGEEMEEEEMSYGKPAGRTGGNRPERGERPSGERDGFGPRKESGKGPGIGKPTPGGGGGTQQTYKNK